MLRCRWTKGSGPAILFGAPPFEIRGVSGAMVDIGLGPTDGFSIQFNLLGAGHPVVSRQMPTIAPAC
jgi:hypothetical protein